MLNPSLHSLTVSMESPQEIPGSRPRLPRSAREAWGDDVANDFVQYLDQRDAGKAGQEQHRQLTSRLDVMNERLDGIDGRLGRLTGRMDNMDQRLNNMDQRLDAMGQRLDGIHRDLSRHTWLSVSTIAVFGIILTAIELFG